MSILVVAEHDNSELKPATRVALAAAAAIGGDVDVLVAGSGIDGVASQAAAIAGVNKVLAADMPFTHTSYLKTWLPWLSKWLQAIHTFCVPTQPTVKISCLV